MVRDIEWKQGPDYPDYIKGGAMGAVGGRVVYASGCKVPWRESEAAYAFDPERKAWEMLPPMPMGFAYTMGVTTPQGLLVAGGRKEWRSRSECFLLGHSRSRWRWQTLPELRQARALPALACAGSVVLCIGGGHWDVKHPGAFYPETVTETERLDLSNLAAGWQPAASFPGQPRDGACAAVVGADAYLFGGVSAWIEDDTRRVKRLADCWRYSTATDEWRQIPDLPAGLSGAAAVAVGAEILIVAGGVAVAGGEGDVHSHEWRDERRGVVTREYSDRVLVFDTRSGQYRELTGVMPHGAHDVRACLLAGHVYAVGGENQDPTLSHTMPYLQIGRIIEE